MTRPKVIQTLVALLFCLLQGCTVRANQATVIQPCRDKAVGVLPVVQECVAAAIAERAFLETTGHRQKTYVISPIQHSSTLWYFNILLGDRARPPLGGHYLVTVERSTGKAEVTAGQ